MMRFKVAILIVCAAILSCESSDSGNENLYNDPILTMDGYGVVNGGSVTAYSWIGGEKGRQVGNGVTEDDGYYEFDIEAANQPIYLEIRGGQYIEKSYGLTVELEDDHKFCAVVYCYDYDRTLMITEWTTLAAGLAEYYVFNQDMSAKSAIAVANNEISDLVGFNILETYPLDISDEVNQTDILTSEHQYGFYSAALSSWTAQISEHNGLTAHTVYNSIALVQLMYADIVFDGNLNGFGAVSDGIIIASTLSMGTYRFSAEKYRQMIGYHILKVAGAAYNQTGLDIDDLMDAAQQYSQKTGALFDYQDPLPVDANGPEIIQTEPEGQYYAETVYYPFRIYDPVGIESLSVDFDGDALDVDVPVETEAIVTVKIRTLWYGDGAHTLTIVAQDKLGNESVYDLSFYINNTGILLNLTSDTLTNNPDYILTGTYKETVGGKLKSITVDGDDAEVDTCTNTWSYKARLSNGHNDLKVIGIDDLGNSTSVNYDILMDGAAPYATSTKHSAARFWFHGSNEERELRDKNQTYPILFQDHNISLGSTQISKAALYPAKIPFFAFTCEDPHNFSAFTAPEDLKVTLTYKVNDIEKSDRVLYPLDDGSNEYLIPLVMEYMHEDFLFCTQDDLHTFSVSVEDKAGNTFEKIFTFKAFLDL
ncbi:MAG: hypothetical protein GY874_23460 [Desulfobacteraceae bacterium]|nr:hypothetical protein [Desulfobacteraceae bacterium]